MKYRYVNGIIAVIAILIIVAILINPLLTNPGHTPEEASNTLLIVSINFGEKQILKKIITANISVMDALKSVANVSTAYDGKFVIGINNVTQDSEHAWFYYINGILANVGANDYIIHKGDIIRWDYHKWDYSNVVSAEILDFPEPFLHGYDGKVYETTIVVNETLLPLAESLRKFMEFKGISVKIENSINLSQMERENVIVIGYPYSVGERLNELHSTLGWKYYVDVPFIVDENGKKYKGAFIQISQSPFNPKGLGACENVIMWIYGSDNSSISSAISTLTNGTMERFWYFQGEEI